MIIISFVGIAQDSVRGAFGKFSSEQCWRVWSIGMLCYERLREEGCTSTVM